MKRFLLGLAVWAFLLGGARQARAGIILTAEAPGVQSTSVTGVITESFNGFAVGTYTTLVTNVGTYTSPGMAIVAPNQFGGANATRYLSVGAQSGQLQATLMTLGGPQAYFGMWWSAADPQNKLEFYLGSTLVANFTPTTALGALSSAYLANPNNGLDPSQKFAYLNFFGTNGTTFDTIKILNDSTSSGFESDNHSIRAAEVTGPLPGTEIPGIINSTPEPASLTLLGIGAVGLVGFAWRRRRTKPAQEGPGA